MKNIMTFSTIVAVHAIALIMIAVQPACTSNKQMHESPKNRNKELSHNTEVILPENEVVEGSPMLRAAPSRPAWTLDNSKKKGEVLVNEAPDNNGLLMPTELDKKVDVSEVLTQATKTEGYVVKAGDNLTKIAKANKTTVATIKDLNNIKTNNIYVGQKLKIPAESPATSVEAQKNIEVVGDTSANKYEIYVVKTGDSLSKVAKKNNTSIVAIKELNALKNDTIFIGQKLKMPPAGEKPVATPAPATNPNYETYTVKAGDMLGSIAIKHKMSLAKLQKLNPSVNPNKLRVGQVLVIEEKDLADAAPVVKQDSPVVVPTSTVAPTAPTAPVVEPTPDLSPKIEVVPTTPTPAPEPTVEEVNIIEI